VVARNRTVDDRAYLEWYLEGPPRLIEEYYALEDRHLVTALFIGFMLHSEGHLP
jgi:hypothetical protein